MEELTKEFEELFQKAKAQGLLRSFCQMVYKRITGFGKYEDKI